LLPEIISKTLKIVASIASKDLDRSFNDDIEITGSRRDSVEPDQRIESIQ